MIANADGTPVLGILMLDTRFPRIAGDAGNPSTWPFPTRIAVVQGASPQRVVAGRAAGLTDSFVASGRDLAAAGATALITTCGFLVLQQRELAARLPVPFAASSLLQLPVLERALPSGKRPGVITIAAASLTRAHLLAAGADPDTPVIGVDPAGEFAQAILGDRATLDVAAAEQEVLAAGERLLADPPRSGCDRPRVRQHAALRARPVCAPRPAGARHGELRALVLFRPAPGRVRSRLTTS